jgi:hypothetical protein
MRAVLRRLGVSPSMVVALVALLVALGGTSYAALKLPRNSVGSAQIKKNAVTSSKVKARSLRLSDLSSSARNGLDGERGPQGPKGDTGPPGPPGSGIGSTGALTITYRTAPGSVGPATGPADDRQSAISGPVTAPCAAGEHATGGGATLQTPAQMAVVESAPAAGGNGWTVRVVNDEVPGQSFTVIAACVVSNAIGG